MQANQLVDKPKVSAVIIAYNEAENIADCIASCKLVADEVVVLDSFSSDNTSEICTRLGAIVFQRSFDDFVSQKNAALSYAKGEWVLSLDADERLSPELAQNILAALAKPTHDAYQFNRLNSYCGHWIRHGSWYPDRKTRLWRNGQAQWAGQKVHEYLKLANGTSIGWLAGDLLHHTYNSISHNIDKINFYSDLAAQSLWEEGHTASWGRILLSPLLSFVKDFVFKSGWRDGFYGLVNALVGSFGRFLKYAKLRQLQEQARRS